MTIRNWKVGHSEQDVAFDAVQYLRPPAEFAVVGTLDGAISIHPDSHSWTFEVNGEAVDGLEEFRTLAAQADAIPAQFIARGRDQSGKVLVIEAL
ncbi:hypothetical protein [Kitasatospora griseola]